MIHDFRLSIGDCNDNGDHQVGRRSFNPRSSILNHQSGFTLVEMIIVMALVAILSVITLSSAGRITANNRSTTCQMNLRHLHQAIMMYRSDYEAYPAFRYPDPNVGGTNLDNGTLVRTGGLGLWGTHTPDGSANLVLPYLKNPKRLKCPHDDERVNVSTVTTTNMTDARLAFFPPCDGAGQPPCPPSYSGVAANYNSYQTIDIASGEVTFQPYRGLFNPTNANFRRQLLLPSCVYDPGSQYRGTDNCPAGYAPRFVAGNLCVPDNGAGGGSSRFAGTQGCGTNARPRNLGTNLPNWEPRDDTVVTWCIFHRDKSKPRGFDNVLFLDGSVQHLPSHLANTSYEVDGSCAGAVGGTYTPVQGALWQRCPKKGGT